MSSTPKIKIAVRMPDKSRRLYVVDDVGMSHHEMRAATKTELPAARPVLIGLPPPAPRDPFLHGIDDAPSAA